jgi:predicted transcriptional regulator YdeE
MQGQQHAQDRRRFDMQGTCGSQENIHHPIITKDFESIHSMLGFDYYPPGTTDGDSPMEIWFAVKKKDG